MQHRRTHQITFDQLQLLSFLVDNLHDDIVDDVNTSPERTCFTERQPRAEWQHSPPTVTRHNINSDECLTMSDGPFLTVSYDQLTVLLQTTSLS